MAPKRGRKIGGGSVSDLEKINIYVPEYIGAALDKDASMFEIFKKDGRTINRNRFLSMLILGYYNTYIAECQNTKDKVVTELTRKGVERRESGIIAEGIVNDVFLPEVPSRKGKNPSKLSLKPTKETEGLILIIMNNLSGNDFISQYFCRMFMSYCQKSFYERERIIFRDNYDLLSDACDKNKPITFSTIWSPKKMHTVIPYRLAVGHDELFNYLLCSEIDKETDKEEARAYRLNRISKIIYSRMNNHISDETMGYLNRMLRYGPQFMINDDEESCVKLSDSGRRNFSRIYFGRPLEDRIEEKPDGHYYYFKGSKDQVFLYFRRFGADAEIISPDTLREKMANFHIKAYENYK